MRTGTCVYMIYRDNRNGTISVEAYEDPQVARQRAEDKYLAFGELWKFHPFPVEIEVKPG